MLQLAAARPQELVGKVIGRGVFNRSHYTHYTRVTLIIIIHKTDCSQGSFAFNFSPPFLFLSVKFPFLSLWRRAALSWIREHGSDQGVIYFADDDNSYDTRIFEEIRKTQWVLAFRELHFQPFLFCVLHSYLNIQPLKGGVSVPGGSGAEVRGELSNFEGGKSERLLWRFPSWKKGGEKLVVVVYCCH